MISVINFNSLFKNEIFSFINEPLVIFAYEYIKAPINEKDNQTMILKVILLSLKTINPKTVAKISYI